MSKRYRSLIGISLLPAALFASPVGQVLADDVAKPTATIRKMIADQRPDESRGWVIIAKPAYWPLCYESMDRLEEAKALIGTSNGEEAGDALDKCSAWLRLAASAAMTDGTAGIVETADLFQEAAASYREGNPWSDAELTDLVTLGFLLTAKSHVLRAEDPDRHFNPGATSAIKASKNQTAGVKEAEKDIAKDRIALAVEQYRYDTVESLRHLAVAQEYLAQAGTVGQFAVDSAIAAPIPELKATKPGDLNDFVEVEIRPRVVSMKKYISEKRSDLTKKLAKRM